MLPKDTITYQNSFSGNATTTVINQPATILSVQVMQEHLSSNTIVYCDNNPIAINYAVTTPYIEINKFCQNTSIMKAGQDSAFVTINYLPYNRMATSTPELGITAGLTYGEVLTNFFLFIIVLGMLSTAILKRILKRHRYDY